jgi:hypothetical protein
MSICKPIYPIDRRNLGTPPNFATFNAAESNPILRYDQTKITTLNVLNNALLINSDLEDYPFLNQRFDQGPISDVEFADFVFSESIDIDDLGNTFKNDFPVPIDLQVVNNLVERVGDITDQFLSNINPVNPGAPITIDSTNIQQIPEDDTPVDRFLPGTGPAENGQYTPGPEISNYLENLDKYYENHLKQPISETNLCSNVANPFAKLSSLIASSDGFINKAAGLIDAGLDLFGNIESGLTGLQDKVGNLLNDIANFSLGNLLNSLVSRLQNLESELLSLVDNLKVSLLSKIDSIANNALSFIKDIKSSGNRIFKKVNKKVQQVKSFLNGPNIERLKDKIKGVLQMNLDQFEELLPSVLNLLVLKACNMSKSISQFMNSPIDKLKEFLDSLYIGTNIAKSYSVLSTNLAIQSGGIRVEPTVRETERFEAGTKSNESQPAQKVSRPDKGNIADINFGNYITLQMTDEEREFVQNIGEDGNDFFVFAQSVKKMGVIATQQRNETRLGSQEWDPNENTPDAGWKMISERHPFIFAALRRVATKLQNVDDELSGPLTLNSCFRSRWYNRIYLKQIVGNAGAATNSLHMSAMAIDISTRNLTNQGTAKLIQRLSEEGFSRISVYDTFVHADIKDQGSYRGNWTLNYRNNNAIRRAMEIHLVDGFRSDEKPAPRQPE